MARINADQFYEKFLAEANEENGNFYFVKLCDSELYERLQKIERNANTNLEESGGELRNVLEFFMRRALPPKYEDEVLSENAQRWKRNFSNRADVIDYQNIFKRHSDIGVDAELFNNVRLAGNAFHHEKAGRGGKLPSKTYRTLCNGLRDMQVMLLKYYRCTAPQKMKGVVVGQYNSNKQPYGDKMVCSVIETLDSTACEKQVLCSRQDERQPNINHYYLLRVYRAENASEGAIRDEKVLSNLWGNSLRGIPNIVRYNPLNIEYDGEDPANEKKYIVSYDFGAFKPCPLHVKLVENFTENQKLMVMHDIATGVQVLHKYGIYHRNLQPNSVFVFFDRNSDFVQAKLIGFEYSKIDGDNATVFARVAKLQQEDPSAFFSITMKQGLKNRQIGNRLDWAKEDIYSLGALFWYILTEKQPQGNLPMSVSTELGTSDYAQIICKMVSPNVMERPIIDDVVAYLNQRYEQITK